MAERRGGAGNDVAREGEGGDQPGGWSATWASARDCDALVSGVLGRGAGCLNWDSCTWMALAAGVAAAWARRSSGDVRGSMEAVGGRLVVSEW